MLPARSGLEILRRCERGVTKHSVLLLTARDAVEDRVLGLESRADDYLVKPFALSALRKYLLILLLLTGIKFVRVFSSSRTSNNAAPEPPAAGDARHQPGQLLNPSREHAHYRPIALATQPQFRRRSRNRGKKYAKSDSARLGHDGG